MPYISDLKRREILQQDIFKSELHPVAQNAGELNYQIFYLVKHGDWEKNYMHLTQVIISMVNLYLGETPNYQKYNDMTGALIRCARELYRRLGIDVEDTFMSIIDAYDNTIASYEDKKILENGDVE